MEEEKEKEKKEEEEIKKMTCPHGGTFGQPDTVKGCKDCHLWDDCDDKKHS